MKTAEQWLADPQWCQRTSPNTGNFTTYGIIAIQADAYSPEALRDQFAAAALTGLLASTADQRSRDEIDQEAERTKTRGADVIADLAYICADAMLARRAQPTADAPAPAPTAPTGAQPQKAH